MVGVCRIEGDVKTTAVPKKLAPRILVFGDVNDDVDVSEVVCNIWRSKRVATADRVIGKTKGAAEWGDGYVVLSIRSGHYGEG